MGHPSITGSAECVRTTKDGAVTGLVKSPERVGNPRLRAADEDICKGRLAL